MEVKLYRGYFGNLYKVSRKGSILTSNDEGATLSAYGSDLAYFKEAIVKGVMKEVK
ncbi:TPA: hypothetical protein QHQ05_004465 [Escherichia coli]|nr:hypothetical protein [Escherichia coli]